MRNWTEMTCKRAPNLPCVILGNSGSLLDTPPQDEWTKEVFVIGVNRILRAGLDGRTYNPDLMFITDGRPMETDGDLIRRSGIPLVAAPYCYGDLYEPDENCYQVEVSLNRNRVAMEDDQALASCGNVVFQAIQLAYLMGHRMIYLLGCEGAWPTDHRPHHFYDVEQIKDERRLRPFKMGKQTGSWFALKKTYARDNVAVVNLTPWLDVDILPFKYASAISRLDAWV